MKNFFKNLPTRSILILIYFFLSIVSILAFSFFLKNSLIDTSNSLTSMKNYMLLCSLVVPLTLGYYFLNKSSTTDEKITDAKRLSNVKRKFLDDILNELKLSIDSKLKSQLESGQIEEANESIVEKIDAINKLIETVNGDNTKSLRGTEISSVSEFYESTSFRIKKEIQRINSISNLNLLLGISTSIIAISVLSFTLLNHVIKMEELVPRVSLSFLIEALAFFFFNQYKKQQENIKYWNNEKTTLDLKIFGLSIAIDDSNIGTPDYMRLIISELLKSEVNPNLPIKVEDKNLKDEDKTTDYKSLYNDLISKLKDLKSLT